MNTNGHSIGVVLPTWLGDAVMATPALRLLRRHRPEARMAAIGPELALRIVGDVTATPNARPDSPERRVFDETVALKPRGLFGRRGVIAAGRAMRGLRLAELLVLPNSQSWGLAACLSGVPRRVGYDRGGRGFLLTDRLLAPRGRGGGSDGGWACVPAVSYYWHAATALIDRAADRSLRPPPLTDPLLAPTLLPAGESLAVSLGTRHREAAAETIRRLAGDHADAVLEGRRPLIVFNPGGNNPAKRWPAERFGEIGRELLATRGVWGGAFVVVSGSPGEADVCRAVLRSIGGETTDAAFLADAWTTNRAADADRDQRWRSLEALVGLLDRARLLVTNDTGPRHIAAAVGCPTVSLFGPTDPRWTTIPVRTLPDGSPAERIITADPDLPVGELSNRWPLRCAIDRIGVDRVLDEARALLAAAGSGER